MYKVIYVGPRIKDLDNMESICNEMADQGWELVSTVSIGGSGIHLFFRK